MKISLTAAALLASFTVAAQPPKSLTLEQLFRGPAPRFTRPLPSIVDWRGDSTYAEERTSGPDSGRILLIDARTGSALGDDTTGVIPESLQTLLPEGVQLRRWVAADRKLRTLIYGHENDLFLLDVPAKAWRRLTTTPSEEQNPTLSPDGRRLAFTRENDLYTLNLEDGRETRHTTDGSTLVLNGRASWLYWEEIFGRETRNKAFWWSPDGSRLVFFRFDDSRVPMFPLFRSRGTHGSLEETRYPKAGDPNPEARIAVLTPATGEIMWADFDWSRDQYFGTPFWTPDGGELFVQWMNRGQDTLRLFGVNPSTGAVRSVTTEHQPSWVDWLEEITFLPDRAGFILRSDRSGWAHLYRYSMDGRLLGQLTSGAWAVEKVIGFNAAGRMVYFTGRKEASTRTDLYSVGLDGTGLRRLTFGPYSHAIRLSPGGSFFITTFSNVATPPRMALADGEGTLVRQIGDSRAPALDEYRIAPTRLLTIPVGDGYSVPVLLTLPPDTLPGVRYPVILSVYGGPGSPQVSDTWQLSAGDQGRASAGLIQVTADHRGSGHFGKAAEALMHRNLGKWELHDFIEVVRWLRRLPCVDSAKICITGSSYGGYVTALALTAGAEYFTHGIASFSVTDWRLYDSHYTERYMDSPEENPAGYEASSVLSHVRDYRGLLRIVHGVLDDNVHVQNALQLADTLETLNKHFELMLYPAQRHGVGGKQFSHYRSEIMRFYYRHLLEKPFPEELFLAAPRMMISPH